MSNGDKQIEFGEIIVFQFVFQFKDDSYGTVLVLWIHGLYS